MAWDQIPEWTDRVVTSLLQALRERDPYTYGHCRRVARNASKLAGAAGLTVYEQQVIEVSSLFHDLGKLGIPDTVLLKPGRLSPREEAIMRAHPVKSAEIIGPLTNVPFFKNTLPGILHHHERIDGRGYPHRLKGDSIPLSARIILISDTFDAMTSTRPYRKALPFEVAYKELKQFSGRQFDEQLVKTFLHAHPTWGDIEREISDDFVAETFKRAA